MTKYNSGRVRRFGQTGITSDRYEFLGLEQAEPDLGDPLVGVSSIGVNPYPVGDQYVLSAVGGYIGKRYWVSANDLLVQGIQGTQGTAGSVQFALQTSVGSMSYTPYISDANGVVEMGDTISTTYFSIPTDASVNFLQGTQIAVLRKGSQNVVIQAASSSQTTVQSTGAQSTAPILRAQYSGATLIKVASNRWYVLGDIS